MQKLWPVLGFEDAFDDKAVLLSCDLSPLAQQSVEQAVMLARASRAMAGDLDFEQAEKLIVTALFEAGERLRRNMNEQDFRKDDTPFVRAIKAAAFAVLRDCSAQCNAERDVVRKLGGLQVIGTSIHESRRVDNQLRGRAGRQGDLGSTAFFVSSEDELLQTYCPGWGSDKLWMFAGVDANMPIYSDVVDNQLEMVQKRIEDFFATHREATFESDRVLDGQREAVYKLRRQILLSGQQPMRERLFKYMGKIVDDACARAGVAGNVNPAKWNYAQLLDEVRLTFIGRRDKWLFFDARRPMGKHPHYLPGVNAEQIMKAILDGTSLPESIEMPPLKMPAAVVKAAISGIEMVYPEDQDFGPAIQDTEPEATPEAISKRLSARLSPVPAHADEDPAYISRWNKGWHAAKARRLRSYLTEAAIQLYLDRFARLSQLNYERSELENVERLWALRAIDNLWQAHLVEMEILRSSVQLRSFGHLDPRDEFRIEGARAFVALVDSIREEMIRNIFFFIGASAEPVVDFEAEEEEKRKRNE
jgi:preprotein translocase subunit SecA